MDIFERLSREKHALKQLSKYKFKLGVISENAVRKDSAKKDKNGKTVGIDKINNKTNAEILFLHEFGSKIQNIPARPILQWTIENSQKIIDKALNDAIDSILEFGDDDDIEKILNIAASRIETLVKEALAQNKAGLTPNSPKTVELKGSSNPLFDTGELSQSILCIVTKD